MKIKYLPILAIALGIGIATTIAGHRTFGDGKLPEILEQFDLNEDGVIDEEERQAAKEAEQNKPPAAARKLFKAIRVLADDAKGL